MNVPLPAMFDYRRVPFVDRQQMTASNLPGHVTPLRSWWHSPELELCFDHAPLSQLPVACQVRIALKHLKLISFGESEN